MSTLRRLPGILLGLLFAVPAGNVLAADLTLPFAGRVSIELIGSEAAFSNTLSVVSPGVAVAISGCVLQAADGLSGVHVVSEKLSQRGCRVELDADPAAGGIQGFAAGTTLRFGFCAQTDGDAACEFVWSSEPTLNSDGRDHVLTNPVAGTDRAFRLNWEDLENLGDGDFDDLIVVVRINADADGDGLWDDWETTGIDTDGDGNVDLDLPSLGANPQHKDIFIEIDWMDCTAAGSDCAMGDTHNHRPSQAAINAVIQAFANANVPNPDGVNGIALHIDVSNRIAHQNVLNINGLCFSGGAGIGSFDAVKGDAANFGAANPRRFAYHYALFTHRQAANSTVSGCGELPGNDFQVSLGGWNAGAGDTDGDGVADQDVGTVAQQTGTLIHELGHNLNLQHGGGDSVNRKPNYLSAMNYAFQMSGIPPTDPDGAAGPLQGRVDYSGVALANLTETALNEPAGIGDGTDNTAFRCPNFNSATAAGNAAIDWDCDVPANATENNITNDINGDRICVNAGNNGARNTNPAGDDVVLGTAIADGPDRTCNTAAAGDDGQVRAVGNAQAAVLTGYNDWGSIKYDFQTTGSFDDGEHLALADVREITYEEFLELSSADLTLSKAGAPDPILTGSDIVYSITVENKGAAQAQQVVVTDDLPSNTTFVSCASTGGGVCGGNANNRTVSFATIPGGSSATVTLVATANCAVPDATLISNTASVATASPEQDASNNSATGAVTASNPPPVIGPLTASPNRLWPPNHKMVDIAVDYSVTDNCGPVVCQLSVASNEPVDGDGDGNTSPDWMVIDEHRLQLRAERAGGGSGRIYTIIATCTDSSNASSSASTTVGVAHDKRK
jgi:uncharacterized repeat protein (TIGR01451 family)